MRTLGESHRGRIVAIGDDLPHFGLHAPGGDFRMLGVVGRLRRGARPRRRRVLPQVDGAGGAEQRQPPRRRQSGYTHEFMKWRTIMSMAVVAGLAAGCQLGGSAPAQPVPSATTTAVSSSGPTTADTAAPPTQTQAASTVPSDKVLASREGTIDDATFKAEITQLARRERFVNLTFTITVLRQDGPLGWQVHNAFSAVPSGRPTVDGVFLVDVKNAKKHLVAMDSEGKCVCSRIGALFLKEDDKAVFSATFAAPPADVSSVDVHIPNVGTLSDVAIS
ncbi:hypothetical protein ABZ917_37530 [Nonomuraea wenchangensis]